MDLLLHKPPQSMQQMLLLLPIKLKAKAAKKKVNDFYTLFSRFPERVLNAVYNTI